MRLTAVRSWAAVFPLAIGLAVSTCGIALSETQEDARWSIDFGAISLSEALDQLTQVTGIKIFTTTPFAHTISPKRYLNQSIEQILKDMLKQVNYAAVWHYSERGIESIGILVLDREIAESRSAESSVERVGTIRPSPRRSKRPSRLQPSQQESGSEEEMSAEETPSEQEEPEDSEADEGDKESETSPTEADATSNLTSSESRKEPTTDASTREESPPGEQQNKSEE